METIFNGNDPDQLIFNFYDTHYGDDVIDEFMANAITIIVSNLSHIGAEKLAKEIGASRSTLRKKFKERVGTSTTEFLRQLRLQIGAELITQGDNITNASHAVGMDIFRFSKEFKRETGLSPSVLKEIGIVDEFENGYVKPLCRTHPISVAINQYRKQKQAAI